MYNKQLNKNNYNTTLHVVITLISVAIYFIPLIFGIASLVWVCLTPNATDSQVLVIASVIALLAGMIIYIIGTVAIPIVQIIMSIVAIVNKEWGLVILNIVVTVILCIVTYMNMDLFFNHLVYAT